MDGPLAVYTDSTYVIQGIEQWVHNWRRRGWKTATGGDVLNRELWEELSSLVAARPPKSIAWHYVRGHSGIPGNERVDEIADAFAVQGRATLYDGPLAGYGIPVLDLPDDTSGAGAQQADGAARRGRSKGPAYSYLSVVDGKPMRHSTLGRLRTACEGPFRRALQEGHQRRRSGGDSADLGLRSGRGVGAARVALSR